MKGKFDAVHFGLLLFLIVLFLGSIWNHLYLSGENQKLLDELKVLKEKQALFESNNLKVIELQENARYDKTQIDKARKDLNELKVVYSDLFSDASNCFYANLCSYDDASCLVSLGEYYPGYTRHDLYVVMSDFCDGMVRDWEKYQSFDYELQGE